MIAFVIHCTFILNDIHTPNWWRSALDRLFTSCPVNCHVIFVITCQSNTEDVADDSFNHILLLAVFWYIFHQGNKYGSGNTKLILHDCKWLFMWVTQVPNKVSFTNLWRFEQNNLYLMLPLEIKENKTAPFLKRMMGGMRGSTWVSRGHKHTLTALKCHIQDVPAHCVQTPVMLQYLCPLTFTELCVKIYD